MTPSARFISAIVCALAALTACDGSRGRPAIPAISGASSTALARVAPAVETRFSPIKQVVIIVQENRSFDNLFDCFKGTACVKRGKERVKTGSGYADKWVPLTPHKLVPSMENTDIGHCYFSFSLAWNEGAMDGFNLEPKGVCPRG